MSDCRVKLNARLVNGVTGPIPNGSSGRIDPLPVPEIVYVMGSARAENEQPRIRTIARYQKESLMNRILRIYCHGID